MTKGGEEEAGEWGSMGRQEVTLAGAGAPGRLTEAFEGTWALCPAL